MNKFRGLAEVGVYVYLLVAHVGVVGSVLSISGAGFPSVLYGLLYGVGTEAWMLFLGITFCLSCIYVMLAPSLPVHRRLGLVFPLCITLLANVYMLIMVPR